MRTVAILLSAVAVAPLLAFVLRHSVAILIGGIVLLAILANINKLTR